MDYKIIDIEGVGDAYAPKLIAAGITLFYNFFARKLLLHNKS